MSLAVVLYIIAAILGVISAFVSPPQVSLLSLAVAAAACGLAAEIVA